MHSKLLAVLVDNEVALVIVMKFDPSMVVTYIGTMDKLAIHLFNVNFP